MIFFLYFRMEQESFELRLTIDEADTLSDYELDSCSEAESIAENEVQDRIEDKAEFRIVTVSSPPMTPADSFPDVKDLEYCAGNTVTMYGQGNQSETILIDKDCENSVALNYAERANKRWGFPELVEGTSGTERFIPHALSSGKVIGYKMDLTPHDQLMSGLGLAQGLSKGPNFQEKLEKMDKKRVDRELHNELTRAKQFAHRLHNEGDKLNLWVGRVERLLAVQKERHRATAQQVNQLQAKLKHLQFPKHRRKPIFSRNDLESM